MKAFRGLMKKVSKGEGGFTLIELLIVIIILGILAAVVAFNVSGFLGAGTEETARTERATVQTAVIAGMADQSMSGLTTLGPIGPTTTSYAVSGSGGSFLIQNYTHLPPQGYWSWTDAGVVDEGCYSGGGKKCLYTTTGGIGSWDCSGTGDCTSTTG